MSYLAALTMPSFFSKRDEPAKPTPDEASISRIVYPSSISVSFIHGGDDAWLVEKSIYSASYENDSHESRETDGTTPSMLAESDLAATGKETAQRMIRVVICIRPSSTGLAPNDVRKCQLALRIGSNGRAHATVLTDHTDPQRTHDMMHVPYDKRWSSDFNSDESLTTLFVNMELPELLEGCRRNLEHVVFEKYRASSPLLGDLENILREVVNVTFEETATLIEQKGNDRACKDSDGLVAHLLRQCGCGGRSGARQPQAIRVEHGEHISVEFSWQW